MHPSPPIEPRLQSLGLIEELTPAPDPQQAFIQLSKLPKCVFLDSALRHQELGRYSFLAADPFELLTIKADGSDGLLHLQQRLSQFRVASIEGLPPFQGGAAGLWSYDLSQSLEELPQPRHDEFQVPAMAVGLYDVVLAWDHQQDRAWIISQGFPETDPSKRQRRAADRAAQMRAWLQGSNLPSKLPTVSQPLAKEELAQQYPQTEHPGLSSNFAREDYLSAVSKAIDYIYQGDVFQVNLSQRLLHPAVDEAVSLYLRLRKHNAAPFAGYFDLGEFQICSTSPERFLQVADSQVEARPIKGTRRRNPGPEADLYVGDELRQSEKDRAENIMIVDLLRNDLSRVCRPESVCTTQLCGLETYAYVQHLVSVIRGTLREDASPLDLLRCAFPGGSITGAPKVRAMEIIAELEPTARGAYCGSLGYLGFDGTLDTSILIRTVTAGRGWWQLPVGGGIVAQSDPQLEYEETWHKAEGMLRALHDTADR